MISMLLGPSMTHCDFVMAFVLLFGPSKTHYDVAMVFKGLSWTL